MEVAEAVLMVAVAVWTVVVVVQSLFRVYNVKKIGVKKGEHRETRLLIIFSNGNGNVSTNHSCITVVVHDVRLNILSKKYSQKILMRSNGKILGDHKSLRVRQRANK